MPGEEHEGTGFTGMLDNFETSSNSATGYFRPLLGVQGEARKTHNDETMAGNPVEKALSSPEISDTVVPLFCSSFVEEPEELPGANDRIAHKVELPCPRHPDLKAVLDFLDEENSNSHWDAVHLEALTNDSPRKDPELERKAAFVEELLTMGLVELGPESLNVWVDEDFLELLKEAADEAMEETDEQR